MAYSVQSLRMIIIYHFQQLSEYSAYYQEIEYLRKIVPIICAFFSLAAAVNGLAGMLKDI
jgi:hypothetical protein